MHFKTKSLVIIFAVVIIMISVGFLVGKTTDPLTGATVAGCKCVSDTDCDDNNECTVDSCLYADNCVASRCIHANKC